MIFSFGFVCHAVVDIGVGKFLEFEDTGAVPTGPKEETDYMMADLQPPFLEVGA